MFINKNTFGIYLKNARKKQDLTQNDVADKLGYTNAQFVSNWERGLCSPPLEKIITLAKLFKIHPEEIIKTIIKCTEDEVRSKLMPNARKSRRKA